MREMVSVLLLIGLLTSAQARLDETRAETTARLGQPWANSSDSDGEQWMYKKGGFNVVVTYLDGRVGEETYLRWGPGNYLSQDDEKAFFQANSGNQQSWTPVKGSPGKWQRTDGATAEELSMGNGQALNITFKSKRLLDEEAKAKAEAEKENHPPIDRSGF